MMWCNSCKEPVEAEFHEKKNGSRWWECPRCGSDDVEEADSCVLCGEPISPYKVEGICDKCDTLIQDDLDSIIDMVRGINEQLSRIDAIDIIQRRLEAK